MSTVCRYKFVFLFAQTTLLIVDAVRLNIITTTNINASGAAMEPMQSTFHVAIRHNQQRYPEVYQNHSLTDLFWPGDMVICRPGGEDWIPIKMSEWYNQGVFHQEGVTVVLSSICAWAFPVIGDYLREMDITILPCAASVTIKRDRYPTAVTLSTASYLLFGQGVGIIMNMFSWRYVAILKDQVKSTGGAISSGRSMTQCDGVLVDLRKRTDIQHQEVLFDSTDNVPLHITLKTAASYSRIMVCCTLFQPMRRLLAAAYDLNMTNGEYEFIYLYQGRIPNEPPLGEWRQNDDLDQKVLEALDTVIVFRTQPTDWPSFLNRSHEINRYRQEKFGTRFNPEQLYNDFFLSCTNAVDLMSKVLDEVRTEDADRNGNGISSRRITDKMMGKSHSLTFENITITPSGEKVPEILVQQFDRAANKFLVIYEYNYATGKYGLVDNKRPMYWKLGSLPLDRPLCNENCNGISTTRNIAVAVVVAGVVMVIASIAGLLRRQQRREQERRTWWRISENEFIPYLTQSEPSQNSFGQGGSYSDLITSKMGTYRSVIGQVVALRGGLAWKKRLSWRNNTGPHASSAFLKLMSAIQKMDSSNLNRLLGICISIKVPSTFYAVCKRGSVEDLILQRSPDWNLKLYLIQDIIRGLTVLHRSSLRRHGNLKSTKCLLDNHMVIKLTDYGHEDLSSSLTLHSLPSASMSFNGGPFFAPHCWMAPEVLRGNPVTAESDVYAFALIAHQIIMQCGVYGHDSKRRDSEYSDDIMDQILVGAQPYLRPVFPEKPDHPTLTKLIPLCASCWTEDPLRRPHIFDIAIRFGLATASEGMKGTFLDRVMQRLEKYNGRLEQDVAERTSLLLREQKNADELLCQMLPPPVVKKLRTGQSVEAEYFDEVSILFSDIEGFTELVAAMAPSAVMSLLDEVYSVFDRASMGLSVHKLETIGSNYVAVSGMVQAIGSLHADQICRLAVVLLRVFKEIPDRDGMELLIGVHSGPVAAGVVGVKRPRYCFFGDSVNTAARLQTSSEPSRVHVSGATVAVAEQYGYEFVSRGKVHLKGKGNVTTYWLKIE